MGHPPKEPSKQSSTYIDMYWTVWVIISQTVKKGRALCIADYRESAEKPHKSQVGICMSFHCLLLYFLLTEYFYCANVCSLWLLFPALQTFMIKPVVAWIELTSEMFWSDWIFKKLETICVFVSICILSSVGCTILQMVGMVCKGWWENQSPTSTLPIR